METLPAAEFARRAAGGDGAAFVRVYDRYFEEVFEAASGASASAEAAAAATRTAFLRVLRRPPALGAPDDDVSELLCALALGAAVEASAAGPDGNPLPARWLRRETVIAAGHRFDEDWSAHLSVPAEDPPPPAVERILSATPLEQPAPKLPRASFATFVGELPLRAAGVVVIGLAAVTFAAAVVRLNSDNPRGATETAAAEQAGDPAAAPAAPAAAASAGVGDAAVAARTRPARRP